MEEQDPITIRIGRAHLPAAEEDSVGRANLEILAMRAHLCEGNVGFPDEIGSESAADGMQVDRREEPRGNGRQERRKEKQDEENTEEAVSHK